MKFISWNVNGLRAVAGKGFADVFADLDADFFCLQETKLQAGQIDLEFRVILARPFTRSTSRCPSGMALALTSTTTRDASSPWNIRISSSCALTFPTRRTVSVGSITG